MFDFNYSIPTDIHIGAGAEAKVGVLMAQYAARVMMLYGSDRIFKTGIGDVIEKSMKDAGIEVFLIKVHINLINTENLGKVKARKVNILHKGVVNIGVRNIKLSGN